MNNNNSVPVKIGYYILFVIIIIILISIIVLLYGCIYKKKIGSAFRTKLSNALTDKNLLTNHTTGSDNYIDPSFIEIYKKNIKDETEILSESSKKKYIVSIDKMEIFGLKFLGIALFIMLVSLKNQEYIEDFTNETSVKLGNLNVLIILIIVIILFAITSSIYLFIKFYKMTKILSIKSGELQLLKQGLLYEPITNAIIAEGGEEAILGKKVNIIKILIEYQTILRETDEDFNFIYPKRNNQLINNIENSIETGASTTLVTTNDINEFFNANINNNLPAPFNGGDNKYSEIYTNTAYMGTIISGASMLVSIISLLVIYKRAE